LFLPFDMDPQTKVINEAYLNACIFEALMRGIHIAVFVLALYHIYNGPKRAGQSRRAMTALVVAFFVLSTADFGAFWAYIRHAFITKGDTAESIAAALDEYPTWFLAALSFGDANAILADGVIIWRTWVIWGRSRWIIVLPIISTMLTTAFSIIAIYDVIGTTKFNILKADYATALYTTTFITTVYCTGAIVYRVIRIGGFTSYRRILEILVESASLYCIATLFALIANVTTGTASEFAGAFWTACTGIAPTLVVARASASMNNVKQNWPWDRDSGYTTNSNPLVSLPRFSQRTAFTEDGSRPQMFVSSDSRTYYEDGTSIPSAKESGGVFKPPKEVV